MARCRKCPADAVVTGCTRESLGKLYQLRLEKLAMSELKLADAGVKESPQLKRRNRREAFLRVCDEAFRGHHQCWSLLLTLADAPGRESSAARSMVGIAV
eukprot:2260763-Pyramimonas_sp.AAC.1